MPYRTIGTDRIMEVSSSPPGTGNVILGGAVRGFRTFTSVLAATDTCAYFIEAVDGSGNLTGPWERGFATLTDASGILSRTIVIDGSSGASTAVNFTTNVRVGCTLMSDTTMEFPLPGGRLTANLAGPVADGTGVATIYYMPYLHDRIVLWNGAGLQVVQLPGAMLPGAVSLNIGGCAASTAYDVYGYLSGGALALEYLAWSTATTPPARTYSNGFLCKPGDATRRYLGSFYCPVSGAGTTTDSVNTGTPANPGRRLLWNMYNRVTKPIFMCDNTASWTYAVNSWRIERGLAFPQGCIEIMRGLDDDAIVACGTLTSSSPANAGGNVALGIDGVSIPWWMGYASYYNASTGVVQLSPICPYSYCPGPGYHYLCLLENSGNNGSVSYGQNYGGNPGIWGSVRC